VCSVSRIAKGPQKVLVNTCWTNYLFIRKCLPVVGAESGSIRLLASKLLEARLSPYGVLPAQHIVGPRCCSLNKE